MTTIKTSLAAAMLAVGALGAVASAPAAAQAVFQVQVAPPAPRYEAIPPPRGGYVWVPGYWDWRGNRHFWRAGYWERARPGYHYAPARWVQVGNHWEMHRGYWGRGDRDGDGIPNRYDRHPNNPYRR